MKPKMFFLMNSIDLVRGGLTRASLKQASFFAEMGYETYMLTFNFNPKYPLIRKKLLEMGKIHKDVIIKNMYEELEGIYNCPISFEDPPKASLESLTEGLPFDKREGHNAYRVYDNGVYKKYINFHSNNFLDFIDYFNENRYRTKREIYNLKGKLKKVAYMDLALNKPRQLIYFNDKGQAYFSQWNNPQSGKVQRILLFKPDGSIAKTYVNNDVTHKVDWLKSVINGANHESVVISDTRSTDEVLLQFNHPQATKIWRLHSSHLKDNSQPGGEIASKVETGFNNIEKFDACVFLSEEQRQDIIQRVGDKGNFKVIPHFHENTSFKDTVKNLMKNNKKDQNLAVIISRLSGLKRIDHSIKAFSKVVKKKPDARLEIWGTGDQENALNKLIKELHLEKNVTLKGYTHNPDDIYKKGLFSILTSKSEGFALSVLESMVNKTPVISYHIKYGPADMIVDNQNGFLVENDNIEQLANKMIHMFENVDNAIEMGKKANRYINDNFNKTTYKNKWLEVVEETTSKKSNK
ncbi:glycosyltransferase [Virgibacillus halodenitrificans]|uniref:glycosyltransferase n=1 Tax=Virgibacillus halodenitrificans TaxID=1482 RepID=UPI001FB44BF3|nr:glycosyltransferase [Virgibacillus halodenitrificans]MCJ0929620.1 glycosyltransferase [Virgibacillus halodenitrificans]